MIMKKLSLVTLFVCVIALNAVFAIEVNKKFGKISINELKMDICPIDSNAHAFYIFDEGETYFTYIEGFNYHYSRNFRIKILDNTALDEASFEIPIYTYGSSDENIGRIKAVTYNLEDGKKIVSQKMGKDAIFREASNKYYTLVKFTLPNVKAGSVLEVSYNITSKRVWDLPNWKFQHYIPVLASDYYVKIPEYYFFNQTTLGYYYIDVERDFSSGLISFKDGSTLNYKENVFKYSVKNVPAFPVGEYLTTPENYLSKVEFELSSFEIPGRVYEHYNTSWADVNKLLLESSDFGFRLNVTGFLKKETEAVVQNSKSDLESMLRLFEIVKSKTTWNEISSNGTSQSLKKTYDEGEGNCADINLLLVGMLREAGLNAYPVALSTRANGIIHPAHASISQLNYVIALCKVGDGIYLMDATDDFSSVNLLPTRCLNGQGRIISKEWSDWQPLMYNDKSIVETTYDLSLAENGTFEGNMDILNSKYIALRKRNAINDYETMQKYVDHLMENNPGLEVKEHSIQNFNDVYKDLILNYMVNITDHAEMMGDLLFFTPLLYDKYEKNPFSLEKREYPIEYPYPTDEKITTRVKLPAGYTIESVPENIELSVLDGKVIYSYSTTTSEDSVEVRSSIEVNGTIFPSTEYQDIRDLFEQVVKKQNERIVLKKI